MATIKVSREIAAPVEDVFALFTDIEHGSAHVSGIKGVEMMTFGEFRLGTKWGETREVLGRLDDAVMEITAFERNRSTRSPITRRACAWTRCSRSSRRQQGRA